MTDAPRKRETANIKRDFELFKHPIVEMRNIILCIIFLIVGCTPPAAYTAFCPVDNQHWMPTEMIHFDIKLKSCPSPKVLRLYVRTSETHRYPQRSLPLEITQEWRHLKAPHTDTILVEITDSIGNRTGKGIHHRDITTVLSTLQHSDSLIGRISIRPCTATPIQGISHIGVELR